MFQRFNSPQEEILTIGGDEVTLQQQRKPMEQYALFGSLFACLVSVMLVWILSGSAIEQYQMALREGFQFEREQEAISQNLEALKSLIAQEDSIREQQSLVAEALPFDPEYQQLVAFFEERVDTIAEQAELAIPEHISWRRVLASDVSNEELQDLGIYQYAFQLEGSYEGVLAFLKVLRESRRLLDLRSLNHFQMDQEGMVSADVTLWAYHIL